MLNKPLIFLLQLVNENIDLVDRPVILTWLSFLFTIVILPATGLHETPPWKFGVLVKLKNLRETKFGIGYYLAKGFATHKTQYRVIPPINARQIK